MALDQVDTTHIPKSRTDHFEKSKWSGFSLNSATTFASMNTLHCHDVGTKNTVILCIYTSRSTSGAVWSVVKRRGRCPRTPVGAVGLRPTGITMPAPKRGWLRTIWTNRSKIHANI